MGSRRRKHVAVCTPGGAAAESSSAAGAVLLLEQDVPAMAPPPPTKTLRLLLVEDHANTANAMCRLFEKEGHQVLVAGTVREALHLVEIEVFDLILCDIGLPDGSGHELLRLMSPPRPTPAIALTAHVTDADCDMCRESGFVAHVPKPVDFSKLREMIEALTS